MEQYTERDWQRLVGWGMCPEKYCVKSSPDGADLVSTGQEVSEQTTRESTDVISEKP
jgi:hypothetical protein